MFLLNISYNCITKYLEFINSSTLSELTISIFSCGQVSTFSFKNRNIPPYKCMETVVELHSTAVSSGLSYYNYFSSARDFRFSRQRLRRWFSYGMVGHAVWQKFTRDSEVLAACINRVISITITPVRCYQITQLSIPEDVIFCFNCSIFLLFLRSIYEMLANSTS
jgi:hypothetical protein